MLHIESLDDGLPIFKALGSEIRIAIIRALLRNKTMNMKELATMLNITNGALTSHIKKLEDCGIISTSNIPEKHGNQKFCSLNLDKILIDINDIAHINEDTYTTELKVGHYSDYKVYPTCGLASSKKLIGELDDIRYFSHPDRYDAEILWLTKGFVEYDIPNFIPYSHRVTSIMATAEISSEAPGFNNNWPSDISFYLNNVFLGMWTSPGDYGDKRGLFTPDWWYENINQYGFLKLLTINQEGTFIDGMKLSNVTIDSFHLTNKSTLKLKLAVKDDAKNIGGLTIFGKSFGNYAQDIKVSVSYTPLKIDNTTE